MKKTSLIIFDGLGLSSCNKDQNSLRKAHTPNFDSLFKNKKFSTLEAAGHAVGILDGQIGNSEVGHLTIGSGRITKQSIVEINELFDNNSFKDLDVFKKSIEHAKKHNSRVHILGLLGLAGVHGISKHLLGVLDIIPNNIEVSYHLFSDGRDSDYKSGHNDLLEIETSIKDHPGVKISSLSGRYYAMDRDNNWDRTKRVYDILFSGESTTSLSPEEYILESYKNRTFDEFIEPVLFEGGQIIEENDVVFFMNYRSDRARQLTQAITGEEFFGGFPLKSHSNLFFVSMTKYYEEYRGNIFVDRGFLKNTLPELLEQNNCTQLHLAETEKFAHVTKFFSGGRHIVYEGQKDILIPSLKVATYDMAPKMSAGSIFETYKQEAFKYDFSVVNFANGDMLGHTGCLPCTVESLEYLDEILGKMMEFALKHDISLLLTADHGNCEEMGSKVNPHTAHTLNPVPCFYINGSGKSVLLKKTGGLQDVAPTLLDIMGIKIPEEMTGNSLIKR